MRALLLAVSLLVGCACAQTPRDKDRTEMALLRSRTVRVDIGCPEPRGWGSGVILGDWNDHIVIGTAEHVANTQCSLSVNGLPAVVYDTNPDKDVAMLLVEGVSGFGDLPQSDNPYLGEPVTVVGYPVDIVSGRGTLSVSRGHLTSNTGQYLRVSAPTYKGNSGGPVFDSEDHLLGLLVAFAGDPFGLPIPGYQYATPVDELYAMYMGYVFN